jgi:hypothetical protein
MANINDSDTLITQTNENVYIDLDCGYGQPSVTTIYLKKNDGTTEKLDSFDNNTVKFKIGQISLLKYNAVEIHTTIDDIRDNPTEELDISLKIVVYDIESNFVDTSFTMKTKGKGSKINSFYVVTIF